jgi:large subunit ribosomal protein L43
MPRLPVSAVSSARAQLTTKPANGYTSFIPSVRKLVFEYCDVWPSSAPLRSYIYKHVEDVARQNPHVEVVVKQRPSKEPVIRGFYRQLIFTRYTFFVLLLMRLQVNNRDKVIGLKGYDVNQIAQKVQLLLDSTGAKIVPLKRKTVVSTTESARGIWSGFHTPEPYKI